MRLSYRRGDTIIEVLLAFAIFALLAVGTTVAMNRGLSMGQRSLERTLVRQQVDAQAELLRYARDTKSSTWEDIVTNGLVSSPQTASFINGCPDPTDSHAPALPNGAFIMNVIGSPATINRTVLDGSRFQPASHHSRAPLEVTNSTAVYAYGIWVQAVQVASSPSGAGDAYDMYIRACWDSVGPSVPMQVSTIVRLYEN